MKESNIKDSKELIILSSQNLTISSESVKRDIPSYWERDYIHQCLNKIDNASHRMLMTFLWMSGLRVSEALTLTKKSIDFEHFVMTVKWLKSRKYNYRNVPIHPHLIDILRVYTANMKADERVFPITRQRTWQLTKKYFEGHPHQMRHSFAVNWLRCGGDIITLSRILGHSNLETTMVYLNIVPIDQGKELIKITF